MDDSNEQAPETPREDGVEMVGDYPLNHRLRAEALARDGKTTDAGGLIGDALIAGTAERLKAEDEDAARADAAKAEEERKAPSLRWTRDKLVEAAEARSIAVTDDMDKAAVLAAIEATPAPEQGA